MKKNLFIIQNTEGRTLIGAFLLDCFGGFKWFSDQSLL